jgi:ribonuclease Z
MEPEPEPEPEPPQPQPVPRPQPAGCPLQSGAFEIRSTAGRETSVCLTRAAFDLGVATQRSVHLAHIFISHGHPDHISAVPQHAARRRLMKLPAASYYVPPCCVQPLRAVLHAMAQLDGAPLVDPAQVVAMLPSGTDPGGEGGSAEPAVTEVSIARDCTVRAWPTVHRVPSQGYTMWRTKKSLKPALAAELAAGRLSTRQLGALRKDGQEIEDVSSACVFAFSGDTTLQAVLDHQPALDAEALVLECTYFDASRHPVSVAQERGHVHLDEIAANAALFRNRRLVLAHFSDAYSHQEITELVASKLPDWLRARTSLAFNLGAIAENMLGDKSGGADRLRESIGLPNCC